MGKFWDLEPSNKWNILNDKSHLHILQAALADQETGVQRDDNETYTVYGEEEALLFVIKKRPVQIALDVLQVILEALQHVPKNIKR